MYRRRKSCRLMMGCNLLRFKQLAQHSFCRFVTCWFFETVSAVALRMRSVRRAKDGRASRPNSGRQRPQVLSSGHSYPSPRRSRPYTLASTDVPISFNGRSHSVEPGIGDQRERFPCFRLLSAQPCRNRRLGAAASRESGGYRASVSVADVAMVTASSRAAAVQTIRSDTPSFGSC